MAKQQSISILGLIILFFIIITGCSKEDDYTKFLEGGEIYYPGKIEGVQVYTGKERVKLFGLFISDPKVTHCLVYWNVRNDSLVFSVSRENLIDSLSEIIELEEGIHNFEFITMDQYGNRSIVVNRTGQSYGAQFEAQLINRPITDTSYVAETQHLTIDWGSMDLSTGAYETEVQYNIGSNSKSWREPIDSVQTIISDYDGSGFKYRTFFRPDPDCLDVFWTDFVTIITD